MGHCFQSHILRQYDIRGTVGVDLKIADAFVLGALFAERVRRARGSAEKATVVVGRDGRLSSPGLADALAEGITSQGVRVIRLPCGPTPMLYFADRLYRTSGAIMVTGSHNPPAMNGFKMVLDRKPFFGSAIAALEESARAGDFRAPGRRALIEDRDCRAAYVDRLVEEVAFWPKGFAPHLVWDAGNGATGEIIASLTARLPGCHRGLFTEIDGRFPNHHPDPTVPENLHELRRVVAAGGADFGVAFDGDGDRIGVVDNKGEILWGDRLMMILATGLLRVRPGATVIADVKTSAALFRHVTALGGVAEMYKTGHALIKTRMAETGALFAGEMSGHLFFADRYHGFDDGLYAAMRLIGAVASSGQSLAEIVAGFPTPPSTPEIRVACPEHRKESIMTRLKARLKAESVTFNGLDGVRVDDGDGWWLIRPSNTEPVLVVRAEADDAGALDELCARVEGYLKPEGLSLPAFSLP